LGEELIAYIKRKFNITDNHIEQYRKDIRDHNVKKQQRLIKGCLPQEEQVNNVGRFFTFVNRERSLNKMITLLKNYYYNISSKDIETTKRSVALVSGALGIGKTTFVTAFRLLYSYYLNENDETDKNLKELIGDFIDVITIDFEETPLQKFERNEKGIIYIIAIRVLFQFLLDRRLIEYDFNEFMSRNKILRKIISIRDMIKLIYGDKKVFLIHFDETQILFNEKSIFKHSPNIKESIQYKFLQHLSLLIQKKDIILLPILSGTNFLATINIFSNSGVRYHPINFELLKWNHLKKIINDLYDDNTIVFPKIFKDTVELLVGHPRLFSSYISCASNTDQILSDSAKEDYQINWDISSKEDRTTFQKESFYQFLSNLHEKEGIHLSWKAMLSVNAEFARMMPETYKILGQNIDSFWLSTKQQLILDILEQRIVKRDHVCYSNLEQKI
jgi:hypothetical protein